MAARMSRDRVAVLAGLAAPLVVAVILVPFRSGLPNTDAALALILVVVAVAASGHRLAGVLAAVSAAAWFDFFLTVPYERFTITRRADIETTVLLLAIGAAVTEIAVRGRRQHAAAARRAGYLDGLNAAARAVATGESAAALTSQVCEQLTGLLRLSGCRFQDGVAGIGRPARLLRDGTVVSGAMVWDMERYGPPPAVTSNCWPRPAACCRDGSCSPQDRGRALRWNSGWSRWRSPTRRAPRCPAATR